MKILKCGRKQTVDLGNLAAKQFSTAKRFVINLESCGAAANGVQGMFNGTTNSNDSTLPALNSASSANSASLVFNGQYVATGGSVTPGSANGDATFTLNYQ